MSPEIETKTLPIARFDENDASLQAGKVVSSDKKRVLPLAKMQMQARVLESACDTQMIQTFENPYDDPIEAIYIFPLPGAAAVYDFELKVGERVVAGEVQERGKAREAYQQALEQGHRAALMEQERDDVFTLQLGNLPPKESIEIRLRFCQQLDYREEGLYELRLPMVVAPRYIPGELKESLETGVGVESDTDIVPDASRITPPRLAPGFDPQLDLQLGVELLLAPGDSLSELSSTQHLIQTGFAAGSVRLELSREGERLNRDFVLRWRAGSGALRSRMSYMQGPEKEGFGLLQLSAPAAAALRQSGRDVIFLLDRSGSMGDFKMASASQACSLLLGSLGPGDRYAMLAFDDQMDWMMPKQVWHKADEAGRAKGHAFLSKIDSRGGTELFTAIQSSLGKVRELGESANTPILVVLTDGEVGDESRILKAIQQDLGDAVVYTIGIDTAVNESFLGRLARLGGGTSVCVTPGEKLAAALKQIAGEIGFPALWDLEAGLPEMAPDPLPDLYQGRSLSVFFKGPLPKEPLLRAKGDSGPVSMKLAAENVDFPALPRLWAKARIQALEDAYRIADPGKKAKIKDAIVAISLEHRILCRFTAWLAVDKAEKIARAEDRRQIVQPVELPEAWSMTNTGALPPPPMMAMPAAMPAPAPMSPVPMAPPQAKSLRKRMAPGGAAFGAMGGVMGGAAKTEAGSFDAMDAELDDLMLADEQAESNAPAQRGLVDKLMEWVAPAKKAKPSADTRRPGVLRTQAPKLPDLLMTGIRTFIEGLEQALQELDAGKPVDADALAVLREQLMAQLGQSESAEKLPALQRLLRQEAQRLIKALQAGSSEGLEPLISRCRQQLELTRKESGLTEFWGETI